MWHRLYAPPVFGQSEHTRRLRIISTFLDVASRGEVGTVKISEVAARLRKTAVNMEAMAPIKGSILEFSKQRPAAASKTRRG